MPKGRAIFSWLLIALGCYVVAEASQWSFKARFFPLVIAIPFIILVAAHLLLEHFGAPETTSGPAVDLELSAEVAPEVARRRVLALFSWIAGFIALVYLVSFPVAVPIFIFSYLRFQSSTGWLASIGATAATWGFFYFLFQRLLHLPFESGALQNWLGV
ncbi:MAG TPA: tripartite tricarboxylate transporter TctB family protein [Candidatus Acidoferrales bacterium]|nr:tripartite tricarboxylate transporter TctB family protein [Candidatus Acidoferrales bacterium]